MYWRIQDICSLANLVALSIIELDDTLLYLLDDRRDSVGGTHGCLSRYCVENLH
jgi:hypothetical protein